MSVGMIDDCVVLRCFGASDIRVEEGMVCKLETQVLRSSMTASMTADR